jgi:nitrile hydratase accessory protein
MSGTGVVPGAPAQAASPATGRSVNPEVAEMTGPDAPPRRNGELVFDSLWEGRAFGIAVTLSDQGRYRWRDFRDSLVAVIGRHDAAGDVSTPYYERFLTALEQLAIGRGLVSKAELDARTDEYVAKRAAQDAARAAADAAEAAERTTSRTTSGDVLTGSAAPRGDA